MYLHKQSCYRRATEAIEGNFPVEEGANKRSATDKHFIGGKK
jgi:hypothetical protein